MCKGKRLNQNMTVDGIVYNVAKIVNVGMIKKK